MQPLPSSSSIPHLLLYCFFAVGLSRWLTFFGVSVSTASLRIGGTLCGVDGVRHAWRPNSHFEALNSLHGFYTWVFDALALLNDFVKQVVVACRGAGLRSWAAWLLEVLGHYPMPGPGLTLCLPLSLFWGY